MQCLSPPPLQCPGHRLTVTSPVLPDDLTDDSLAMLPLNHPGLFSVFCAFLLIPAYQRVRWERGGGKRREGSLPAAIPMTGLGMAENWS